MICPVGAKLLEKMTFGFSTDTKVEVLAALIQKYTVKAKVNGLVIAESWLAVLPSSWDINLVEFLFEINRPVNPGDVVIAELESITGEVIISPPGGVTVFASVSVVGEV